ncbi:MAG: DoxX family protein [Pseudomonadales bacterium]
MNIVSTWHSVRRSLEHSGTYLAPLGLRILLAWEFFEAGLMKYQGSNWFTQIQSNFPFPFDVVPTEISWTLATYVELIGGVAILVGLGTRFFSFSLIVLTVVATAAVHWPGEWSTLSELLQGYSISDKGFGNYKLPALYLAMLVPLLFVGPGKLSADHLVARLVARSRGNGKSDVSLLQPA